MHSLQGQAAKSVNRRSCSVQLSIAGQAQIRNIARSRQAKEDHHAGRGADVLAVRMLRMFSYDDEDSYSYSRPATAPQSYSCLKSRTNTT
eukprot:scaffold84461_cov44-Prasinocladus_malaysianus.AAC.2